MTKRTCFELGVCQSRKPACQGCNWQLAPGTIRGPYRRQRTARSVEIRKVLWVALLLMLLAGVATFPIGYFNLLRWLP